MNRVGFPVVFWILEVDKNQGTKMQHSIFTD